jgi:3-hydroxyacyl-CoA dehydrogenase/enoyl-CoA hydratase/3-hydroxybutyryl-CoA epimerase
MLGIQKAFMSVCWGTRSSRPRPRSRPVDEIVGSVEELVPAAKAGSRPTRRRTQPWDAKGYKMPGGTPQPGARGHPAVVPGAAAQAAQGRADAGAAGHHGRRRRGRAGRLRHRQRIESRYFTELVTGRSPRT